MRACLLDLEKAVGHADDALTVTGGTDLLRRTGLASGAVTDIALIPARHADVHLAALGGFLKRNFELEADVVAAEGLLASAACPAAAEQIGEDVAEGALEVCAAHIAEAAETAGASGRIGINARLAVAIVGRTLLIIGQHGIRFTDFLELFFCSLVARIAVRVVLHCHPAVSLLDFFGRSTLAQAEQLVIILIRHNPKLFGERGSQSSNS